MNAEMLKAIFASGAVSAAVAFGVVHAAMPKEEAPRAVAQPASAQPAAAPRQSAAISSAESSSIREAYSDGGYQDWIEHQKAMP